MNEYLKQAEDLKYYFDVFVKQNDSEYQHSILCQAKIQKQECERQIQKRKDFGIGNQMNGLNKALEILNVILQKEVQEKKK